MLIYWRRIIHEYQKFICLFDISQRTGVKRHRSLMPAFIEQRLKRQKKRLTYENWAFLTFPWSTSNISVAIFQNSLHISCLSQNAFDTPEHVLPMVIFINRGKLLTNNLSFQRFQYSRLKSAFRKLYGEYNDLVWSCTKSNADNCSDVLYTDFGSWRVWHVKRGCLLLWCNGYLLWYIWSLFAIYSFLYVFGGIAQMITFHKFVFLLT